MTLPLAGGDGHALVHYRFRVNNIKKMCERFKAGECRSALSAIPDVVRDGCVIEFQTQEQDTGIEFETSMFF